MNTKKDFTQVVGIFVGMTFAGVLVVVVGQFIPITYFQIALAGIGSALFCAGLTFFLVKFGDKES